LIALVLLACGASEPLPPPPAETGAPTDSAARDSATDSATPDGAPFILGATHACESPRPAITYTESSAAWGLLPGPAPDDDHLDGGGIVVDDLDRDGDLDVVIAFWQSDLEVYTRVEGGFERAVVDAEGAQLTLADVDADGWRDLIVSGHKPRVYSNDGGALTRGKSILSMEGGVLRQLAPGDFDGDGDLDLYAPATSPDDDDARRDLLLWNDGSGEFEVDRDALPAEQVGGQAFLGVVFDYEVDGDPDVYVDNDMGPQYGANVLLRNRDGALEDASSDCACGLAHSGMGGDAGDYNGDGLPDLYLSGSGQNVLLASQPGGEFVDVTLSAGADPLGGFPYMAWGSAWLDYDNDGQLDVVVAQGDLWAADHEGDHFDAGINLMRQSEGTFEDVGPASGLDAMGSFRGVSAADHNGDGVLDLLIHDVVGQPLLYLSDGCTEAGWLAVDAPLGSRVEVTIDGAVQTAWIHPTSGFGAAGPLEAWFGLGQAQQVDRLQVTLPWAGGVHTLEGPLEGRRRVTLELPSEQAE